MWVCQANSWWSFNRTMFQYCTWYKDRGRAQALDALGSWTHSRASDYPTSYLDNELFLACQHFRHDNKKLTVSFLWRESLLGRKWRGLKWVVIRGIHGSIFDRDIPAFGGFQRLLAVSLRPKDPGISQILKNPKRICGRFKTLFPANPHR